jgi:RNA polymerase sigma factor (sigma-70 family)
MSFASGQKSDDAQLDTIMRSARRGENLGWTRLIARYDRMMRSVAGSYRLGSADLDDVVQASWAQLYLHIDRIREPRAVSGWLATTVRREAMRVLQRHVRERLSDDLPFEPIAEHDRPETELLAAEERVLLGRALATLPGRQRALLTMLVAQPDANYQHISTTLAMPVGSIGPVRARGLARLQRDEPLRQHHLDCA